MFDEDMNTNYINDPDALVWATHYGIEEEFHHCIARGDDLDAKDEYGRTPLHAAAEEGWFYYAKVLLDKGADFTMEDKEGDTPLDYAIFHGHQELSDLLRRQGAKDRDGLSAKQKLEDTVYEGFASADAAKKLIALVQDNKIPNNEGCSGGDDRSPPTAPFG